MNCLALEQGDDLLVIDCGTSFPSEDIGVDVIIPDFSYLLERKAILRGVFLTHGHDDHIGALPALLGIRALHGKTRPPRVVMPAEIVDELEGG